MVWLNGEFRTKPWTQVVSGATPSPPTCMWMRSLVMSQQNQRGRSPVVTWALGSTVTRRREWLPGSGMLYFSHKGSR